MEQRPLLRLTTAPDPYAPELFDLIEGRDVDGTWLESAGFTLGEPTWDHVNGSLIEGTREITLPVMIDGAHHSRDTRLMALSQALLRPHRTVYLQWRLSPAQPSTWFRLHQTSKSELDYARTYSDPTHRSTYVVPVTVVADAWGLGERVDLPTQTVKSLDAQQGLILPDIYGTAPAPLVLDLTPSHSWSFFQQLINVTSVQESAQYEGTRFWAADEFTPRGGATLALPHAEIVWDEAQGAPSTGALIASFAQCPTYIPPGSYRALVMARHLTNDKGGGWFKVGTGGHDGSQPAMYPPWVSWTMATGSVDEYSWIDCGILSIPSGATNAHTMSEDMPPPAMSVRWRKFPHMSDGLDFPPYRMRGMVLIPAGPIAGMAGHPTSLLPTWGPFAPNVDLTGRFDAEHERIVIVDTDTGQIRPLPGAVPQGGWPRVVPGARNYVTVLSRINPTSRTASTGTDLQDYTVRVGGHYYPRYLHTAGSQ